MKKYILLTLLTLSIDFSFSQETIIPIQNYLSVSTELSNDLENIYYIKDTDDVLNKFLGTWVYDDGINYLSITFTKALHINFSNPVNDMFTDNKYYDILESNFIFKINGVTIYNSTSLSRNNEKTIGGVPYILSNTGGVISYNSYEKLSLAYYEPTNKTTRNRKATLVLEYDNTNGETLNWDRIDEKVKTLVGNSQDTTPYKLPANMVLEKQ